MKRVESFINNQGEDVALNNEKAIRFHSVGPVLAGMLGAIWNPTHEGFGNIIGQDFRLALHQYLSDEKMTIRADSIWCPNKKHHVIARDVFDYKTRESIKLEIGANPMRRPEDIARDIRIKLLANAQLAYRKQLAEIERRQQQDAALKQAKEALLSFWPESYQGSDAIYTQSAIGGIDSKFYSSGELHEIKIKPKDNLIAFRILSFLKSFEMSEASA